MPCVVQYGADSSVRLEFSDGVLLAECGSPDNVPLDDPAAAVRQALDNPLDYPALAQSTTPGDRVVLALDHGVPRAAEIVAAVVGCLVDARVDPDGITVLQTRADACHCLEQAVRVPDQLKNRITLTTHDPTRREELAYLAANEAGEPILLNRAIHDADLVLPIGCLRSRTAAGYHGIHGTLYPTFSDTHTLSRFRSPDLLHAYGRQKKRLVKEVDEVGWLLGVTLTVQVVPGPGESVLDVLAGEARAVERRGRQLYEAVWGQSVSRRAELVVATVRGGPTQQTWQNLGRAIEAAMNLVQPDGAIAICSDLAAEPGPAIQRLAGEDSPAAALKHIDNDRPDDTLPAAQLARALDRGKVYLLSKLEQSLVEDLDIIPLAGPDELIRLARRFNSCIVLSNAPHAIATIQKKK